MLLGVFKKMRQGTMSTGAQTMMTRTRNPLWDALVAEFDYGPHTRTEERLWGRVVASLARAEAVPEDVARVCAAYRKEWPLMPLTITALEKHWSMFLAKTKAAPRPPCSECGVGGGYHAAWCPTLSRDETPAA